MGLWRDILRALGLTNDARVHISAPNIDVVITGDPEQVRHLLGIVKHELERNAARRELAGGRKKSLTLSQVVQPTELDEMDSPYVLPEAMVLPVEESTGELVRTPVDEETYDEPKPRIPPLPAARAEVRVTPATEEKTAEVRTLAEPATLLPEDQLLAELESKVPLENESTRIAPRNGSRVKKDPSGPSFVPDPKVPFATDGGPTLTPADGVTSDLGGTDPEVRELDSDPGA